MFLVHSSRGPFGSALGDAKRFKAFLISGLPSGIETAEAHGAGANLQNATATRTPIFAILLQKTMVSPALNFKQFELQQVEVGLETQQLDTLNSNNVEFQ